jgi:hypothetical protein
VLEKETLIFWIAAQRLRLTPVEAGAEEVDEALDDLVCIHTHTDSDRLAKRCSDILDQEAARCGFSA